MKTTIIAVAVLAGALTGCASDVITYDANGHQIGECKASGGWIIGGGAACTGLANGQTGGFAGGAAANGQTPLNAPASK